MPFSDEEPAARSEQIGDQRSPSSDIGQPAQRADTGVHEVEVRRAEYVHGVIELCLDELDVGVDGLSQCAGLGQ